MTLFEDLAVQPFPVACGCFTQSTIQHHGKIHFLRQGIGRLAGPLKIAGNDGVWIELSEHCRSEFGLPFTYLVKRDVTLALEATPGIPVGLSVTPQDDRPAVQGVTCAAFAADSDNWGQSPHSRSNRYVSRV